MDKEYNTERVVFYPPNDLAAGMFVSRVSSLLNSDQYTPSNINEAIELQQCSLTVETYPEFFPDELDQLNTRRKLAYSAACKYVNEILKSCTFQSIIQEVELQYMDQLFGLVFSSGAYKQITREDMSKTLNIYPHAVCCILEKTAFTERFKTPVREFLINNPRYAAELLIGQFGSQSRSSKSLHIPPSLTTDDINSIILTYLKMETCNLNYVRVLLHWPSGASKLNYTPSKEVLVEAERKEKQLNDELFNEGSGISHSLGITISPEQKACKGVEVTDSGFITTYGSEWLSTFTDPGTIMNNFVFLFDFIDSSGRLTIPAHAHENSTFFDSLGLHALNEYKTSILFSYRNGLAIGTLSVYRDFLAKQNIRLEDAFEWVFSDYLPSDLEVEGFSLHLPTQDTSFLDKCKAIGPEVERLLITFTLYVEKHSVDPAFLPHMMFNGFLNIPSLIKNKYVEAGPEYIDHAGLLFSDQSLLAFSEKHDGAYRHFFEMIVSEDVYAEDFAEFCKPLIDQLIETGTITIGESGKIIAAHEAFILKEIWDKGAIEICKYGEDDKAVADKLVSRQWLSYSSNLFSTDEANYLSYMFNDATFSNSIGLRNKYDHGNRFIDDPNSPQIIHDYDALLTILVCVILKINEDLCHALNVVGIEELVDWPLIDDSVIEAAKKVGVFNVSNPSE